MIRNSYAKFYYNTRYLMPLMIGIIVGFALSLLCTPFYDCESQISSLGSGFFLFSSANSNHRLRVIDPLEKEHQKEIDEYEPRINLQGKPKTPQKPVQKLIRPRYASTELNIKYKLFIGVLSTKHLLNPSTASFLNLSIFNLQSLNQNQQSKNSKITFFINNPNMNEKLLHESTPPGISVVNFNDNRDNLLPFHSFKYVTDNFIKNYDWFFFTTDETFIRASKLLDMLNHISTTQDLYMGYSSNDKYSIYCSLSAGIIFSNSLLQKMLPEIEWCTKNAYSNDPSENIGRCVLHSSNMACSKSSNGLNVTYHVDENFNFDQDISRLAKSSDFNNSLTIFKVKDFKTMFKLQIYFNQVDLIEINSEIENLKENILELVCDTPEGCNNLQWPLTAPPSYKPINRHEVIRWDYFNQSHLFLGGDFDVVTQMSNDYQQDVNEIIEFSLQNLNKSSNKKFKLIKLLNGYKQFDPTRGSAYILDLILNDNNILVHKRVNAMRTLGLIEIIPMPYVTESSKINLVVTFECNKEFLFEEINNFFSIYQKYVLDVKDQAERVNLIVVYLFTLKSKSNNICSNYIEPLIQEQIQKKYSYLMSTTSRIIEVKIDLNSTYSNKQLSVIETISKRLSNEALILLADNCVELQAEFLNRVRLNTVPNSQIYFPIPFDSFLPQIVYSTKPYPVEIEINKYNGYFNRDSYQFSSFYNSDYMSARNSYLKQFNLNSITNVEQLDLYDLFQSADSNLHLLRATDQALKCRWSNHYLTSTYESNDYVKSKLNSIGTKAQLAMHLIKNYDKIFSKNSEA